MFLLLFSHFLCIYFLIIQVVVICVTAKKYPETSCLLDCSDMLGNKVFLQRCVAFFNVKKYNSLLANAQQYLSSGE